LRSHLPFWGFHADAIIPGELRGSLEALIERIPDRGQSPGSVPRGRDNYPGPAVEAMNNAWIAQQLNEVLSAESILVNETITHRLEILRRATKLQPGGFYEASFGGLGMGLSVGLGVKHAHPARPVVVTIGDGAFHYNPVVACFGASQELGLPILVVLFDNAGYASQKGDVIAYYPIGAAVRSGRFAGTSIAPRPEYAKLAEAYGGYGEKVERPQDVRAALEHGLEQNAKGRLALIHMVLE
jgi:acetolactate synthase-1/2/3 large subunit